MKKFQSLNHTKWEVGDHWSSQDVPQF